MICGCLAFGASIERDCSQKPAPPVDPLCNCQEAFRGKRADIQLGPVPARCRFYRDSGDAVNTLSDAGSSDATDPVWNYRLIIGSDGEPRGIVRRRNTDEGPYDQVREAGWDLG